MQGMGMAWLHGCMAVAHSVGTSNRCCLLSKKLWQLAGPGSACPSASISPYQLLLWRCCWLIGMIADASVDRYRCFSQSTWLPEPVPILEMLIEANLPKAAEQPKHHHLKLCWCVSAGGM